MTTPSPASPRQGVIELAALAAALAGEHAAVYAYGFVGAQAGPKYRRVALERLSWHGLQRDVLAAQLSAAGTSPQPAEAAYALPFEVTTVAAARRLAVHVEQAMAAAYADLVAAEPPTRRGLAATWLGQCAVQSWRWGGVPQAFPGLPERG